MVLVELLASDRVCCRPAYGNEAFKRLQLHLILYWMLEYAQPCGGDVGLRYTASAISACRAAGQEETVTKMYLHELAIYWFTHFLFFCV